MRKTLLICGALLAMAAPAFAQGHINLAWNDCVGSGVEVPNFNNACTQNSGVLNTLIASFQPPFEIPHLIGCEGVIDLQTNGASLSPWWHMEPGGCRAGRVSWSADFLSGPFSCLDVWEGAAIGSVLYEVPSRCLQGPNTASFHVLQAMPGPGVDITPTDPTTQSANEYYAFKIIILKGLSTGAGSCAGCLDKVSLALNFMALAQPAPTPDVILTLGPGQIATYNGGTFAAICPGVTPTRISTWGSIKALYR